MLETLTLDQLGMFVTVVEAGSFSAAARKLRRVQSAVSHAVANLEESLGVTLFDRSTRIPLLTDAGRTLLSNAQQVLGATHALRASARSMQQGLEPQVSLVVDAICPVSSVTDLARGFQERWPMVRLELHTETLDAVAARVRDGRCALGVVGPAANTTGLQQRHLTRVRMVPVASSTHPLAKVRGRIPMSTLQPHVQVVLGERGEEHRTPDQGVASSRTWRVVDLHTKHALLRAGLGWGNLPEHLVRADLQRGRLVELRPEAWARDEHLLTLSVVWQPSRWLGPATLWSIQELESLCVRDTAPAPRRGRH